LAAAIVKMLAAQPSLFYKVNWPLGETLEYKDRIERSLSEQVADHLRRELTSEEKRLLDLAEGLLEHRYDRPKDKLA
jgi:hypothetical protein